MRGQAWHSGFRALGPRVWGVVSPEFCSLGCRLAFSKGRILGNLLTDRYSTAASRLTVYGFRTLSEFVPGCSCHGAAGEEERQRRRGYGAAGGASCCLVCSFSS